MKIGNLEPYTIIIIIIIIIILMVCFTSQTSPLSLGPLF